MGLECSARLTQRPLYSFRHQLLGASWGRGWQNLGRGSCFFQWNVFSSSCLLLTLRAAVLGALILEWGPKGTPQDDSFIPDPASYHIPEWLSPAQRVCLLFLAIQDFSQFARRPLKAVHVRQKKGRKFSAWIFSVPHLPLFKVCPMLPAL